MDLETKGVISRIVGARIAYYRGLLGMTQRELAKTLSISPSTISKIEQGKYGNSLSMYHLLDISEVFGISSSALMHTNDQDRELLHRLVNEGCDKKSHYNQQDTDLRIQKIPFC